MYYDASLMDPRTQEERIAAGDAPVGSTAYYGSSGRIDTRAGIDVQGREAAARAAAASYGLEYDPSDLEGFLRHTGYQTGGTDVNTAWGNLLDTYRQRANNVPGMGNGPSESRPTFYDDQAGRAAQASSPFASSAFDSNPFYAMSMPAEFGAPAYTPEMGATTIGGILAGSSSMGMPPAISNPFAPDEFGELGAYDSRRRRRVSPWA